MVSIMMGQGPMITVGLAQLLCFDNGNKGKQIKCKRILESHTRENGCNKREWELQFVDGLQREGRGRGGFGGGFRSAQQLPFELFPEIEGLGIAEYSTANIKLIKWARILERDHDSSPYYYEDRSERPKKMQKPDIERYSDRQSQAQRVERPLWHFVKVDSDHMPAELADDRKRVKKVKWTSGSGINKLDLFEKLEQSQGKDGKKENEDDEEEEEVIEEDEGEFSDEGDYEQTEYFDDDEDDFNMADDNDDEPIY